MLSQLRVKNFAVVKDIEVNFASGLSAVTGETGAGKSIAIDALSLCLGERADANSVRTGAEKAEIIAHFDITKLPSAQDWLDDQALAQADDPSHMFIRRVISHEGRSKAFINGVTVSLTQLKAIGAKLVNIHGQNAHHQLLKPENQRQLLDQFGDYGPVLQEVASLYQVLASQRSELTKLEMSAQQRSDRKQLLSYQVQELDEFAIGETEFEQLELEHKKLSNSQTLLEEAQKSFYQLYEGDEFNALSAIKSSMQSLQQMQNHDPSLAPIVQMLSEASISVQEASNELRNYCDQLEIDPMRMQQVEQRYSMAMELARKHQVSPESLYHLHMQLAQEFSQLDADEASLDNLRASLNETESAYNQAAKTLSEQRSLAATSLSAAIEQRVQQMNMPHAKVNIVVSYEGSAKASKTGQDQIAFLVSTNPGQQPDTLDKVVSGGELSRIGLAIQVISAADNQVPTLLFDEVDTGISGPTAAVVGKLLRELGKHAQVICVTHLPQVAAQGHQQLFVSKYTDGASTETQLTTLNEEERVNEVARLLAGDSLTESAIANAKDLLRPR